MLTPLTARRRPAPVPWVFHDFCVEFLGLADAQITAWWSALARATWPASVSLKQTVLYQHAQPKHRAWLEHLARVNLCPKACIEALEALLGEGRMSRQESSGIEETILDHTTALGEWR